jgi:putative FmdB family regulatory protein
MPLYEYQCDKCGKVFEVLQKFSDTPLSVHEGCGGNVVRLISAPGLQFKGSGWYVTDYARSASGGGSKSEEKGASKSDSAGEKKSESKPAADTKSDSKPASSTKSD